MPRPRSKAGGNARGERPKKPARQPKSRRVTTIALARAASIFFAVVAVAYNAESPRLHGLHWPLQEYTDAALAAVSLALLGDKSAEALSLRNAYADRLRAHGKLEAAEVQYKRTLNGRRYALGTVHPNTIRSFGEYASVVLERGRAAEALPLFQKQFELLQREAGPEHHITLRGRHDYARALLAVERFADALPHASEVHRLRSEALGPEAAATQESKRLLAAARQGAMAAVSRKIAAAGGGVDSDAVRASLAAMFGE